jgi:hypothetical protein
VHVLFMDVVGSTKYFSDDQQRIVESLQTKVRETPEFQKAQTSNAIIAIPTGDGMALVFFNRMEAPLRCALELSQALRSESLYKVRMGIHSGPVYVVEDINGQRNVSGAGINRAQRVMDCGDADHILLSDTMAESLRQIREWGSHIKDIGECRVKDGWQHVWSYEDGTCGSHELPKKSKRSMQRRQRVLMASLVCAVAIAAVLMWVWLRPPAAITSLNYSMIVKPPNGEERVYSKEMIVPSHYQIKIKFQAKQAGYLYLINEGPETSQGRTWRWLFPYPAFRNGSGALIAGDQLILPDGKDNYFELDEKSGPESLFVIWSLEPVADLEKLRGQIFSTSDGKFNGDQASVAQRFVAAPGPSVKITSDQTSTTLSSSASYLRKTIILEHL